MNMFLFWLNQIQHLQVLQRNIVVNLRIGHCTQFFVQAGDIPRRGIRTGCHSRKGRHCESRRHKRLSHFCDLEFTTSSKQWRGKNKYKWSPCIPLYFPHPLTGTDIERQPYGSSATSNVDKAPDVGPVCGSSPMRESPEAVWDPMMSLLTCVLPASETMNIYINRQIKRRRKQRSRKPWWICDSSKESSKL